MNNQFLVFLPRVTMVVSREIRARHKAASSQIKFVLAAEAAKTMGDFAECLAIDQHVDGRKAVVCWGAAQAWRFRE